MDWMGYLGKEEITKKENYIAKGFGIFYMLLAYFLFEVEVRRHVYGSSFSLLGIIYLITISTYCFFMNYLVKYPVHVKRIIKTIMLMISLLVVAALILSLKYSA